eukprot:1786218-Rhodomonas_salina.1
MARQRRAVLRDAVGVISERVQSMPAPAECKTASESKTAGCRCRCMSRAVTWRAEQRGGDLEDGGEGAEHARKLDDRDLQQHSVAHARASATDTDTGKAEADAGERRAERGARSEEGGASSERRAERAGGGHQNEKSRARREDRHDRGEMRDGGPCCARCAWRGRRAPAGLPPAASAPRSPAPPPRPRSSGTAAPPPARPTRPPCSRSSSRSPRGCARSPPARRTPPPAPSGPRGAAAGTARPGSRATASASPAATTRPTYPRALHALRSLGGSAPPPLRRPRRQRQNAARLRAPIH